MRSCRGLSPATSPKHKTHPLQAADAAGQAQQPLGEDARKTRLKIPGNREPRARQVPNDETSMMTNPDQALMWATVILATLTILLGLAVSFLPTSNARVILGILTDTLGFVTSISAIGGGIAVMWLAEDIWEYAAGAALLASGAAFWGFRAYATNEILLSEAWTALGPRI